MRKKLNLSLARTYCITAIDSMLFLECYCTYKKVSQPDHNKLSLLLAGTYCITVH